MQTTNNTAPLASLVDVRLSRAAAALAAASALRASRGGK